MNLHEVNVRLYMKTEKSETYEAAMSRLKCQTMRDLESNKRIHGRKRIQSNIELQHSQCTMHGQRPQVQKE